MRSTAILLSMTFLLLLSQPSALSAQSQPPALEFAHAHNDYAHPRPLFDALDEGFCSVEADVFAVDGRLLVGHELGQTTTSRTLESLYLAPLAKRAKQNGGSIQPGCQEFTLLIDFKTETSATYALLARELERHKDLLTSYRGETKTTGAITVILTGNRPTKQLRNQALRYAALDGRLDELNQPFSSSLVPLVSATWTKYFSWNGEGSLPAAERAKLRAYIEKAHTQGKRLRFWTAPDNPNAWRTLRATGVDLINTDHLKQLRETFSRK